MQPNTIEEFNDFQKSYFNWAIDKRSALILAPPGAGKSLALVGEFMLHRKRNNYKKMIVITRAVGFEAIHKANIGRLIVKEISGVDDLSYFYPGNPFNFEILLITDWCLDQMIRKGTKRQIDGWVSALNVTNILAVDELHYYRSYDAYTSQALLRTTNYFHQIMNRDLHRRFRGITATPSYTETQDWYQIMNYTEPALFPSWEWFKKNFCKIRENTFYTDKIGWNKNGSSKYQKKVTFDVIVGYKNLETLYSMMEPYIFKHSKTDFVFDIYILDYKFTEPEAAEYAKTISGEGLDKAYQIHLRNVEHPRRQEIIIGRDRNDYLYTPKNEAILVENCNIGTYIKWTTDDKKHETYKISEIEETKKDGSYLLRMIRAVQYTAACNSKLEKLYNEIKDDSLGCLIFCSFVDSVYTIRDYIKRVNPGKRVVTITGDEGYTISEVSKKLLPTDIVVCSPLAQASVDFYYPKMIFYETPWTGGTVEQCIGRITRANSPYRHLKVCFVMRPYTIEEYMYLVVKDRIRRTPTNSFATYEAFPESPSVVGMKPEEITEDFLTQMLWNQDVYK